MRMTPERRDQLGFTLIEMLVTVVIVGFIVGSLSTILIGYLKVSSKTQSRLNETTDQQLLSAYWQQDVSSLGYRDYAPAETALDRQFPPRQSVWTDSPPAWAPGGCVAGLPGPVVIGFVWNDYPSGKTSPAAAFNAAVNGVVYTTRVVGSQQELWRTRCGTDSQTRSFVVSHRLTTDAPAVSCLTGGTAVITPSPMQCTSVSPLPAIIKLTMTVSDRSANTSTGYTVTLTAQRRQG